MADLSEFEHGRRTGGRPCEYRAAVDLLAEDQQENLEAAIAAEHISDPKVAEVLEGWTGRRFDSGVIGRHRRGECVTCRKA